MSTKSFNVCSYLESSATVTSLDKILLKWQLKCIMSSPGEDQVRHLEAVPRGVLQEPVAAGAVVHEDHQHDGQAEEEA